MHPIKQSHILILFLSLYAILLAWSALGPKDYTLWILEVAPALIGIGLCIFFYSRLKFTTTTYLWCFIAVCLMTIGAHYSYSEVPLFNYFKEVFSLERNSYDKLGHFVQGVVPVLISQEVLIRNRIMRSTKLMNLLSFCVAMTIAALYELIEWMAILLSPDVSENFLGMQGYIWDAQSDIFFAMLGALSTILFTRNLRRKIFLNEV